MRDMETDQGGMKYMSTEPAHWGMIMIPSREINIHPILLQKMISKYYRQIGKDEPKHIKDEI